MTTCGQRSPANEYKCTLDTGHTGQHLALDSGALLAVWQ